MSGPTKYKFTCEVSWQAYRRNDKVSNFPCYSVQMWNLVFHLKRTKCVYTDRFPEGRAGKNVWTKEEDEINNMMKGLLILLAVWSNEEWRKHWRSK